MNRANFVKLEQIVRKKSGEWGLSIQSKHSGSIVFMQREEWHLFAKMKNPLVTGLSLEMAIYVETASIHMLIFPSPSIIKRNNADQFIRLANAANQYLYHKNTLGRFWIDEDSLDFAYEICLKENMLEYDIEEVSRQLFDIPYSYYTDMHIPLVMLAGDIWESDTAINYLNELRKKGYVYNSDYSLW